MSKIKIMDELLANKIAAGEVVERCVNVVKELVENSIDAKSTEIKIELMDAGTKQIKVTDNGVGMDRDDAVLAFSRHATSKLKTEEDLYRIETLGFRGEALASIASVSEVVLTTCSNEVGTNVIINGGKIERVENSEARIGTVIEINNLFYNTPARLKHLSSLYAELANITDYVNKIALSNPNIKFMLINNGNTLLQTSGNGDLLKVIYAIYGLDITKKMLDIQNANEDYTISGYISLPEVHRASRNAMVTLVNGRVVRNQELNRIINDSYHSFKPDNRYPVVVLNIEVDPSLIDVNIHPTKMDIKFSNFDDLKELVKTTIQNRIKSINLIPHIEVEEPEQEIESSIEKVLEKPKKTYEEITLDFDVPVKEDTTIYQVNSDFLDDEVEEKERMPMMYPVGAVHGTYIICQNEKGMYLIDQHAAKERINYEICLEKLTSLDNKDIKLLIPLTFEYTTSEYIILKENLEFLRNMNFEIEPFGINSVIIKAHPTWIPKGNEEKAIRKVIELVIYKEKNFNIKTFNDHLAATMACKMSIKANDSLTLDEMKYLVEDLRKCKNPFNCPHGRPTTIFYSTYDLEKLFKRSGF